MKPQVVKRVKTRHGRGLGAQIGLHHGRLTSTRQNFYRPKSLSIFELAWI